MKKLIFALSALAIFVPVGVAASLGQSGMHRSGPGSGDCRPIILNVGKLPPNYRILCGGKIKEGLFFVILGEETESRTILHLRTGRPEELKETDIRRLIAISFGDKVVELVLETELGVFAISPDLAEITFEGRPVQKLRIIGRKEI